MNVHYFQHVPFEGLDYIEIWLEKQAHTIQGTRFFEHAYAFPPLEDIDALIIMGGPMGVYDERAFPWLKQEKAFIKACIKGGKKVFGICLGAQLIATALGAKVFPAPVKEIGWFRVMPTEECHRVPWMFELFKDCPTVFHWHGDQFDIPQDESIPLLVSDANANQAFYYGKQVIGLQFHLEVSEAGLVKMAEHGRTELRKRDEAEWQSSLSAASANTTTKNRMSINSPEELMAGIKHIKNCNRLMDSVLRAWLG